MLPKYFRPLAGEKNFNKVFKNVVIFYHEQCQDGEVANVCAIQGLRNLGCTLEIKSIGRSYQREYVYLDEKGELLPELSGAMVFYVDFAPYPEELSIIEKVSLAVVLDHHDTARKIYDIQKVSRQNIYDCLGLTTGRIMILDNNRSGAGVSWDFFNPHVARPELVNLVEDRDLWRFKFKGSRELALYIQNNPPESWGKFFNRFSSSEIYRKRVLRDSKNYYDEVQELITYLSSKSSFYEASESVSYRLIESSAHHSDLGNKILEDDPAIAFAVIVVNKGPGKYKLSFRSEDCRMSVGALCERFGGGGHRNAAGITVEVNEGETIEGKILELVKTHLENEGK